MKHVYWYFLLPQNSGYDIFNSVIRWHPASTGYPACIKTSNLDPRLLLETRLLLEVLRYITMKGYFETCLIWQWTYIHTYWHVCQLYSWI